MIGKLFSEAKRKHTETFHDQGKAINEKVKLYAHVGHALIDARQSGTDPFAAIEAVVPREAFMQSVTEADHLAQPTAFDCLPLIADGYRQVRRYAPRLLEQFAFRAAPAAQHILDGIGTLAVIYQANLRVVPKDAPTGFVKPRWEPHVLPDGEIDRRFYELCALSELKNALRAGDIWVPGSRQFKDFEDYLLPPARFAALRDAEGLPATIVPDGDRYLHDRLALLSAQLHDVDRLAAGGCCPRPTSPMNS